MHHIVSPFILQQYKAGIYEGRLKAAGLFEDVARFSTVTSALMEHGQEGAEAMAVIMRSIYEPTVRAVHNQGGFIAGRPVRRAPAGGRPRALGHGALAAGRACDRASAI